MYTDREGITPYRRRESPDANEEAIPYAEKILIKEQGRPITRISAALANGTEVTIWTATA